MHEILTVQLGQRANYLATHFWNAQECYQTFDSAPLSPVDHDIHFRQGIGADGSDTYLPRTVIYDLKGGFGSLRQIGPLYEAAGDNNIGTWNGNTAIQQQPPITISSYQQSLDNGLPPPPLTTSTVRYWSDFNHLFFHPRSIVQLNDYSLNSTLMPFERWESGDDLFNDLDKEHDLLDRDLRLWAEECDQIQGIQFFTGSDDAWGGFAARYVEKVRDEYGKVAIWVWGLEEGQKSTREKQLLKTTNAARSLHAISGHASLYIPVLEPPSRLPDYVALDRASQWHTSALLSTAIESMTLPSRLRASEFKRGTLDVLEASLNVNGNQRIVKLQCSVIDCQEEDDQSPSTKQPSHNDSRVSDRNTRQAQVGVDEFQVATPDIQPLDMDFLPSASTFNTKSRVFGVVESYREAGTDSKDHSDEEYDEHFMRKRRRVAGIPLHEKFYTPLPIASLTSFPPILSNSPTLAVHTSLSTTSSISTRIKNLQEVVKTTVSLGERETLYNDLGELAEAYDEGWSSGYDEGEEED